MSAPTLELEPGMLRGVEEDGVHVFRGVPYAAPPVGALRFAPPAPTPSWAGVRDAREFGPIAPQGADLLSERLGLLGETPIGEDCLTLNVWRPAAPAESPRAILLWIHGGAFLTGASSAPAYDGARLAREGGVVVVSIQYRVGFTGFGHVPGLAANRGLRDQVAALRFVQRHAEALGGGADRITVFGESAGAGSLCALLAMPSARGLFRRAIVQSAAPAGVLSVADATARGEAVLGELGLGPEDLARLEQVPRDALLEAQARFVEAGPHAKGMAFLPTVDGEVLPCTPLEAAARGDTLPVELVVGTTRDEMRLFALAGMGEIPEAVLPAILNAQLAPDADDAELHAARIVEGYRKLLTERTGAATAGDLFFEIQTDLGLRYPSELLARRHASHGGRVHVYLFTWRSPLEDGALGACHALDLPFVFGSLGHPAVAPFAGSGPEAEALSAAMRSAWTGFSRSGDPSPAGEPAWPEFDPERRAVYAFGATREVLDDPGRAELALWDAVPWREL